jgi:hypothetical protein
LKYVFLQLLTLCRSCINFAKVFFPDDWTCIYDTDREVSPPSTKACNYKLFNGCEINIFIWQYVSFLSATNEGHVELHRKRSRQIERAYALPLNRYDIPIFPGESLSLPAALDVVRGVQIRKGDNCWDLSCGRLHLTCALSAAAQGGTVIATESGPNKHTLM